MLTISKSAHAWRGVTGTARTAYAYALSRNAFARLPSKTGSVSS
jgi:hypothetical protein